MAFVLPRAKKAVCERRSVVSVVAVGERVMRSAGRVRKLTGKWWTERTQAGELDAEQQVKGDVVCFCLCEEE
jgi:hypothetical protein